MNDNSESQNVLLVSDRTGRLFMLDVQLGETEFAAARRVVREWDVPADAPADRTYYQNAGLHEVPRRLLPKDIVGLPPAHDIRGLLSARKLRTIENDCRTYNLTECVHPTEPACAAGGAHDWASDADIDGGTTTDAALKRAHCRRPSCHATKSWAGQADRPEAHETDVPFMSYGVLDAQGKAAHDAAYAVNGVNGANNDAKVNDINRGRMKNTGDEA